MRIGKDRSSTCAVVSTADINDCFGERLLCDFLFQPVYEWTCDCFCSFLESPLVWTVEEVRDLFICAITAETYLITLLTIVLEMVFNCYEARGKLDPPSFQSHQKLLNCCLAGLPINVTVKWHWDVMMGLPILVFGSWTIL